MRKVIASLLFLVGAAFAALSSLSIPNEDIDAGNPPQVLWVDQNFDSVRVSVNRMVDTVNALQAGTAAFSGLTASLPMFTNASKRPVSNAMTGTGSVMMSHGPVSTGTLTGASSAWSGTLAVTGLSTLTGNVNVNGANNATDFRLNVNNGYIAVDDAYAFRAYSDGAPGEPNSSFVALRHNGAGDARIEVDRSGSGSYRGLRIYTSGSERYRVSETGDHTITGAATVTGSLTADSIISAKFYAEGTHSFTLSNGFSVNPTGTARYVRVGKQVTLTFPQTTGTSTTGSATLCTALPAALHPARNQQGVVYVIDNNAIVIGAIYVETNGAVSFYVGASGNFQSSGTRGISELTFTYTLQ